MPILWLIPEEILSLRKLVALALGREYGFERIRIVTCIPRLGSNSHRGGCEVLHLFEVEVQLLGDDCQFSHILFLASWMRGDEVGDDLLMKVLLAIDAIENALELIELLERGLAHQFQHAFAGVLWRHLQTSAHMVAYQLTGVFHSSLVASLILTAMQQQIVAHATPDKAFLDTLDGIDGMVDIQQFLMVGVEVWADLRMNTTGTLAFLTSIEIFTVHAIHIGRGSTKVGKVAFEVWHLYHLPYLF